MPLFETVTDLAQGVDLLRRRRFGMVAMVDGRFQRIHLRPWPKVATAPGVWLLGGLWHRLASGDRVWLYYNQPWGFSSFLVLRYVVSARSASLQSVARGLALIDEIARIKRSDAILCDVGNHRVSTRLLGRCGWEPHCPTRWHRHYIKRFYG
ncbi:MAG: hypothetical protein U1E05_10765, partial [Patescibacteria group bacterium]|nr:hypothetical protein [Patescibacteria group bacterium]